MKLGAIKVEHGQIVDYGLQKYQDLPDGIYYVELSMSVDQAWAVIHRAALRKGEGTMETMVLMDQFPESFSMIELEAKRVIREKV